MITAVQATVSKLVESNVASLGLGGDHLTSYPALKAHAEKHGPLSLIHFDAHADLMEALHLFHGSMFGGRMMKPPKLPLWARSSRWTFCIFLERQETRALRQK
jgi:arginase family enzyme